MRARRPRHLRHDEAELWQRITEGVAPLPGRASPPPCAPHPAPALPEPAPLPPARPAAPLLPEGFAVGGRAAGLPPPRAATALPDAALPPRADPRLLRRLSRGRTAPEARIDLHGMTLDQAERALRHFVLSSQAQGRRLVLVITGKGREGRDDTGPVPERPGALRRHVPLWLARPPFSAAVVSVTEAHRRHGGSGACYVHLRRPRG